MLRLFVNFWVPVYSVAKDEKSRSRWYNVFVTLKVFRDSAGKEGRWWIQTKDLVFIRKKYIKKIFTFEQIIEYLLDAHFQVGHLFAVIGCNITLKVVVKNVVQFFVN